jgi:hypothetical protein
MRVVLQGLAPGMENQGHAELGAEMPGSRDGGKCLGRRAEQDRVNGLRRVATNGCLPDALAQDHERQAHARTAAA